MRQEVVDMYPEIDEKFLAQVLNRECTPVTFFHPSMRSKTVLITGAGGSIGAQLSQQLAQLGAKKIVLVEHSEFHLYQIYEALKKINTALWQGEISIIPVLASVTDNTTFQLVFSTHRPDWVFHAAAYKHVQLVQLNPQVALKNNVYGTYLCASLALAHDVEKFILVSTDKAVQSINLMGGTKALAEMVVISLAQQAKYTQLSIARFGNVIGSSGSLIPKIMQQMLRGEAVTIAQPIPTRYFMLMSEAIEFLLQLLNFNHDGCHIYARDMGKPYQILDLAKRLSTLLDEQSLTRFVDIDMLPYEKIEEVCLLDEQAIATSHPKIFQVPIQSDMQYPLADLMNLLDNCDNNPDRTHTLMKRFISSLY
jgi:FlaA1/EpsC-like NDP-sugar epimerase